MAILVLPEGEQQKCRFSKNVQELKIYNNKKK